VACSSYKYFYMNEEGLVKGMDRFRRMMVIAGFIVGFYVVLSLMVVYVFQPLVAPREDGVVVSGDRVKGLLAGDVVWFFLIIILGVLGGVVVARWRSAVFARALSVVASDFFLSVSRRGPFSFPEAHGVVRGAHVFVEVEKRGGRLVTVIRVGLDEYVSPVRVMVKGLLRGSHERLLSLGVPLEESHVIIGNERIARLVLSREVQENIALTKGLWVLHRREIVYEEEEGLLVDPEVMSLVVRTALMMRDRLGKKTGVREKLS